MKKLAATLCAFALALALPMTAFADGSPEPDNPGFGKGEGSEVSPPALDWTEADVEEFSASIGDDAFPIGGAAWIGSGNVEDPYCVVVATKATNTPAKATVIASYEITGKVLEGKATLYLAAGADMIGKKVTVFIQHATWNEQQVATVDKFGMVKVTVTEFSTFTIVEGDYGTNSPKTGADTDALALGTFAALVIAGGALVMRKKVQQ